MSAKKLKTKTRRTPRNKLNRHELAALRQLGSAQSHTATLAQIAARFRRAGSRARAMSWARNSVRKPVRMGIMVQVGRGTYRLSPEGVLNFSRAPRRRAA